jgi:tetratricopeptide (TPR) repeat protein
VSAERGLSLLVGREQELSLLLDCFARVRGGRGQMVGVIGEAGVGKSRLVHEFRASLAGERITWLAGHCVAYGQGTPYLPVLEILRANFDIEEGDNPLQIEEKLRQGVRQLDPALESTLGHELATTHALLRDVPRARACAGRALAVLPGDYSAGVGMARRPLVLALALAGEVTEVEPLSEAVWQLERGTFYGCIFEDGMATAFHYRRRGNMQRAQEYLDWVTPVFRERNLGAALSGCSFVTGCLAFEAGRLGEAEAQLSASLEVCRRGGNVLFELWVLPVLAETYLRSGRLEKTAECVTRGLDLLTSDQDWRGLSAPIHLVRGMLAGAERRWDEAERSLGMALTTNRRYELPWDEVKTPLAWGTLDGMRAGAADRERSRQRFGAALEIFQRIGASREIETAHAAFHASA